MSEPVMYEERDAIALITDNPEDDTVLLVNEPTTSAFDPLTRKLAMGNPLAINIDSLGLPAWIDLDRMSGSRLNNLKHIYLRLKFTYHKLTRAMRCFSRN